MRWWQRVLWLLAAGLLAVGAAVLVVTTVDEAADRFRARGGPVTAGLVTDRSTGSKNVFPDITVAYEVDGRTYVREIEGFLDLGEQVQVRHLRQEPAVSRVVGEGGPALVADALLSLLLLASAPFGARHALQELRRPRTRSRRTRPRPRPRRPEPERPGDRHGWHRRVPRAAAVGGAAGAALWGLLAAWKGAGPPREVATALLGLAGSGGVLGASAGWIRSRGELRRSGQRWTFRLGVLGLLASVPVPLLLAVALEG